jgi:hypothetical protein
MGEVDEVVRLWLLLDEGEWRKQGRDVCGLAVLILVGEARWVDPTLQAQFQYRISAV